MTEPNPNPPATAPRMAAVLVADRCRTLQSVISCLRREGDPRRLELILVTLPGGFADAKEADLAKFGAVRRVEVASIDNLPLARAKGVRAATAEWVYIGETHCFPKPGWSAALLRATEGPWVAVVPSIGNADRRGWVSRAGYATDYARWSPWRPRGEMADPLLYHSMARREALLSLGENLDGALDPRTTILWDTLFARGDRVLFEPAARMIHLSVGRFWPNLLERFLIGVVQGGKRASIWSLGRRAVYFLGSPLVPFVLLYREAPASLGAPPSERLGWNLLPFMFLGVCSKAVGEMLGYIIGIPVWVSRLETDMEIHRLRYCPGFKR